MVERPAYDLTVFKLHFKRLTVKIYSKGERVLRIEVIAHNTKDLRSLRSIVHLPTVVNELKQILECFVSVLDSQCEWIQNEMMQLFQLIGVAA